MTAQDFLVELRKVTKRYPDPDRGEKTVLAGIDLRVRAGEFISLVGPSGCGKSTLLRLVLGSELPSDGHVLVDGVEAQGPSRDRGIVFQKYSLFPNRTVLDNVILGPDLEEYSMPGRLFGYLGYRRRRQEYIEEAMEVLERMKLGEAAGKYPYELSGGMRQRVAIAQAAIMKPKVLLMDEPFGALDDATRQEMQLFILELWEETGMTIFFITHDLEEAIYLGSRVVVLSQYYSTEAETLDGPADLSLVPMTAGAKIVKDREIPGGHPKPTGFRYTPEFSKLLESIRRDGLDPAVRQHVDEFDLSHRDAGPGAPGAPA